MLAMRDEGVPSKPVDGDMVMEMGREQASHDMFTRGAIAVLEDVSDSDSERLEDEMAAPEMRVELVDLVIRAGDVHLGKGVDIGGVLAALRAVHVVGTVVPARQDDSQDA